jgi:hypothetical protein
VVKGEISVSSIEVKKLVGRCKSIGKEDLEGLIQREKPNSTSVI